MVIAPFLLASMLESQVVPPASTSTTALERTVHAAEVAAEAALRAARAAEKIAGITSPGEAPHAAAVTPAPPAPPTAVWAGTIGFGLIWLAGNSETLTVSGNGSVELKTEHWIFGAKGNGVYGESVVSGSSENQVVALAAGLLLRGDRRFTERVTGYVALGADTDHVKSINRRGLAEVGSGITWFEEKEGDFVKTSLRTDLGFRYAKEVRFQYYPTEMNLDDVELIAPRLGIAFRYGLSKDLTFTEDAEALPNVVGDARFLLNSLSKLSVRLTQALSFAVGLDIKHDSSPAIGKKDTDSALTIGLEVGL